MSKGREQPVLMSLVSTNGEEAAKRIIEARKSSTFTYGDFNQIAGTNYGSERIKFEEQIS